jgi:hypothetical protein
MSRRFRKSIIVPFVAALCLAGGALAYFTATGSGSGSGGATLTLQPVTIAAGSGNTQTLLPTGAPSGDLRATISNSNNSSVHIGSLLLDSSQGSSGFSTNAASCALSFATQNNNGSGWTIPAGGQLSVDLTNSLTMGTTAVNSCQNQTFTVYLIAQ